MPWVLAVPGGLALGVGLWAAWVRYVEHGLFAAAPPPPPVPRAAPARPATPAPGHDRDLEFARVLHRAATMNLEECEDRAAHRALPPADVIDASSRERP